MINAVNSVKSKTQINKPAFKSIQPQKADVVNKKGRSNVSFKSDGVNYPAICFVLFGLSAFLFWCMEQAKINAARRMLHHPVTRRQAKIAWLVSRIA